MKTTSIITIAKNHATGLQATLTSIELLEGVNFEIILVIGSSNDRTLQIAQEFTERTSLKVRLLLQSGSGIYEAMNEGAQACSGDSILFMNAGDCFENAFSLKELVRELKTHKVGVVIGGYIVDKVGQTSHVKRSGRVTPFSFAFNRRGGCHQAMLYKTDAIKQLNLFPLQYRLAADFDLTLRVILAFGGRRIPQLIAVIEPGGVADKGIVQVHKEKHLSRSILFGKKYLSAYSYIWSLAAITKFRIKHLSRNFLK